MGCTHAPQHRELGKAFRHVGSLALDHCSEVNLSIELQYMLEFVLQLVSRFQVHSLCRQMLLIVWETEYPVQLF